MEQQLLDRYSTLISVVDAFLKERQQEGTTHIEIAVVLSLLLNHHLKAGLIEHLHIAPETIEAIAEYYTSTYGDNPYSEQGISEQNIALSANLTLTLYKIDHIIRSLQLHTKETPKRNELSTE